MPGLVQETLPSLWMRIAEHQKLVTLDSFRDGNPVTNMAANARARTSSRIKILDLVLEGAALAATDPRDRIFALFGLGEETHAKENLPAMLRPDYSKSTH